MYTEDHLVQKTTAHYLEKTLGWHSIYAYDREDFGENSLLGRHDKTQVILDRYLYQALETINPGHPPTAYQDVIKKVKETSVSQTLMGINREKHKLILDGHRVTYTDKNGKPQSPTLKIIDFDRPENNHFLCVRELWIQDPIGRTRRADIIGFVNGIPLIFCELKNLHRDLRAAYNENYRDYLDTITQLFHYNAIVLLGNGSQSKIGSLGSPYEYFHEWKRLAESEPGVVAMETLLRGVCDKANLLDILENFILFDDSEGETIKIIARNHQYLGVNLALQAIQYRQAKDSKLGVFWHTQGSGKSYSMVFLCRKVHRKLGGNYSFVICTDREDLDGQIYDTFAGCGLANNDKDPCRASSQQNLAELLQCHKSYIFTLIQKFNQPIDPPNSRDDIIVISDEAHRSQYGTLALNLRASLPNAGFLGFTGTPLFKEDEITRRYFGDYVSTYDFQRAVEDKATVPLYYDSRGDKLKLATNDVNDKIAAKLEELALDDHTEDKLRQTLKKEYGIITSDPRLEAIAQDFVQHYATEGSNGKAMFICLDKLTCVKMHQKITHHWHQEIERHKQARRFLTDQQAAIEADRKIRWLEETLIAVVVSAEQGEVQKFRDWGLDINPHRALINNGFETEDGRRVSLEKAYKDSNHPFRVAIVCAMWLTGFDVPSLSVLYLDKPLKAHTLMQAIARANRVHEGKNNGLIVDYCGILSHLRQALATFSGTPDDGRETKDPDPQVDPAQDQIKLLDTLQTAIAALADFLAQSQIDFAAIAPVIEQEPGFEKIQLLNTIQECINRTLETRQRFKILCREVIKIYQSCLNIEGIQDFRSDYNTIRFLYKLVSQEDTPPDLNKLLWEMQTVIDATVTVSTDDTQANTPYDISKIDFECLRKEFEKSSTPRTTLYNLQTAIEARLKRMLGQNSHRINFQHRFEAIIARYNEQKDQLYIQQIFDELLNFIEDLDDEQRRAHRENLDEETLALFETLCKDNLSKKEREHIKKVAVELLTLLKSKPLAIDHWRDKESVKAEVETTIYNYLYDEKTGLPVDHYTDDEVKETSRRVFLHIIEKYPSLPSPFYRVAS